MTKQELDELKLLTINDLIPLGIALERRGQWKSIRHWESDKWKFECVSDTEYFKTESVFEAVDWFYDDLKPDEEKSKPESKVKFSAEVNVQVTDEYIEKAKREAKREILEHLQAHLDVMAQRSWELYIDEGVEQGNDMHLGEQRAFAMTLAQVNTILKNL